LLNGADGYTREIHKVRKEGNPPDAGTFRALTTTFLALVTASGRRSDPKSHADLNIRSDVDWR